jgi:hypothetical protein
MTPITIDCPMTAMEVVGGHVNVGRCAMIVVVVVVCRHGSDAMQSEFYDELSLVFAVVTMLHIPVYIVDSFNVRFDHPEDSKIGQLLHLHGPELRIR